MRKHFEIKNELKNQVSDGFLKLALLNNSYA